MRNQGYIRQRGKESWQIKFDAGRDPTTGKRQTQFLTFRGTRKEARLKLAELIASVGKGSYVTQSSVTVLEHVRARVEQWQALGKITPKTAERYRELLENQIAPHLGKASLQKLKPADIERWHATLKKRGRKDGGALGARTIRHAHRLLSKALKEAMRHDLVLRNAAAAEPPPQVEAEEVVVLDGEQIKLLVERLRGRAMYSRVIHWSAPGGVAGAEVARCRSRWERTNATSAGSGRGNEGRATVQDAQNREQRSGD
jgi:hypothetical protein